MNTCLLPGDSPILKPLDTIECRDAILTPDDRESEWPVADIVIGNPPFLGGKLLITHLTGNCSQAKLGCTRQTFSCRWRCW